MSLRELIDPECGGANPLMRFGNHIVNDTAHKDDGISGRVHDLQFSGASTSRQQQGFDGINETQLVDEFLGQMHAPPPQSFRMDTLLQEMREIDATNNYPPEVVQAPIVSHEINNSLSWAGEFSEKTAKDLYTKNLSAPKYDANEWVKPITEEDEVIMYSEFYLHSICECTIFPN